MKNIAVRTVRGLGAALRARRLELGWSQAQLAERLGVQRQWVMRLEAGREGTELGTTLNALNTLGLVVEVGNEPSTIREQSAPAANLDEVFARLRKPETAPSVKRRNKE